MSAVPPDSATCPECLRELFDPADRRYRYPFVSCARCGPGFTIARDVPYDRASTTMAAFDMCARCVAEHDDPADRRFHAPQTCCATCGPSVRLVGGTTDQPVTEAAGLLLAGRVVAIKGLGGYHLAVLASDETAVARLRARKHSADRPFTVMASDMDGVHALAATDDAAVRLLTGRRAPIVPLPKRADAPLAPSVAPGNRRVGVVLPYTPLHHLLLAAVGEPIALTSGNAVEQPITYRDTDAMERLRDVADAFLVHDRPIHVRTDDSVVRSWRGTAVMLRRARGYVPDPVPLPVPARRPILACGADLRNTVCLADGRQAYVSQHIGDLENQETLHGFTTGIEHLRRLLGIEPEIVAYDLQPGFMSSKHALDLADGMASAGVQHHHAHIASCLADNGETGPVLGVAMDGSGYGTDGTSWGGEFLLADLADFRRLGHLEPVPIPGGAEAVRQPWRMAVAYLDAAYRKLPMELDVLRRNEDRSRDVIELARYGAQQRTSSAARLLDAMAAILGIRDAIRYEGQAVIELEQRADPGESGAYSVHLTDGNPIVLPGVDLVRGAVADLQAGVPVCTIAARVHNGLADAIVACCVRLRGRTAVGDVALSGAVFQNLLLLDRVVDGLREHGFRVLTHSKVPANDGGISVGQAAIAAARDARS